MPEKIPEQYKDLLEGRTFAHLATIMADGSPQVTPVWCDFDGTFVIVNSAKGRLKDRNMRGNPRVALSILDPENPYRYLEIRGRVAEITEEGAEAHIHKMARKYLDVDEFPHQNPDETRVIYRIAPERFSFMG